MPTLILRLKAGTSSAGDIEVNVQDQTYDFLLSTSAPEVNVSGYLDRDWESVASEFEELASPGEPKIQYAVKAVIPGSRTRKGIVLPGAMMKGEQLVIRALNPMEQEAGS